MPYSAEDLKRKLREVKRIEINLRFKGSVEAAEGKLVWNEFFEIKRGRRLARYPIQSLIKLDRQALKNILDEYFYTVYYRIYKENGFWLDGLNDPNLLSLLGLPANASEIEIKKRFRELAKKFHPDTGGDSEKFIELMNTYDKLKSGNR